MAQPNEFFVFNARPAYAYREETGDYAGMMVERHLDQLFIADSYLDAVKIAIAWSKDRFEQVIKDSHTDSFFSSLKVSTKCIAKGKEDGSIDTRNGMTFFEWKYDTGNLETELRVFSKQDYADRHPANTTDLERFIALYAMVGISLNVEKKDEDQIIVIASNIENEHEKIDGYDGFYTKIVFDKDGTFKKQGFWE